MARSTTGKIAPLRLALGTMILMAVVGCGGDEAPKAPVEEPPPPKLTVALYQRNLDGTFSESDAPPLPSMPSPKVTVDEFSVTGVRNLPGQDYLLVCDIAVKGTVTSKLCDLIAGESGLIEEVRLFVNEADKPARTFPMKMRKTSHGDVQRPFPFKGEFEFEVKDVEVTEGVNTFRFLAADKVYGLDGFSLWAATFEVPFDEEEEEKPEKAPSQPTLKSVEFVRGGSEGELNTYALRVTAPWLTEDHSLAIGDGRHFSLRFTRQGKTDSFFASLPGSTQPAAFTLRPTCEITPKAPDAGHASQSLTQRPGLTKLNSRSQFIHSLSQGIFLEGADLLIDPDLEAKGAVRYSPTLGCCALSVGINKGGKTLYKYLCPLTDPKRATAIPPKPQDGLSEILWHFADLYRTGDPKADEMVLGLILDDLSEAGLEGVTLYDWRGKYYFHIAELLETFFEETTTTNEVEKGFELGRIIGETLRITLDPDKLNRLDSIGKAEFLERMLKMPVMAPQNRPAALRSLSRERKDR